MFKTPLLIGVILLTCHVSAKAAANWKIGDFVRQTQRWDEHSNRFLSGAAEGEGEGGWQITRITPERITMKLISGNFKPWWTDKPIAIGTSDEWSDSGIYKDANPNMPPLSEIHATFMVVTSCK